MPAQQIISGVENTEYLGDGVYIGTNSQTGVILIFTYDGVEVGDYIYLESEVLSAFDRYRARIKNG